MRRKYEKDVNVAAAGWLSGRCRILLVPNNRLPLQELLSLVIGFAFGFSRVLFACTLGRPHNIMCKISAVTFPLPASNNEQPRSNPAFLQPVSNRVFGAVTK
jgi:hypothetical protein